MWDLAHLVQLKKARTALKTGRLEEAYEIATTPEYRDYRQCQDLLQQLVPRLLDRARAHLEAGRTEDALADIARAQKAGGNQTDVAELRQETLATIENDRSEAREIEKSAARSVKEKEAILRSVRGHIDAGRLTEGAVRLAEAGLTDDSGRSSDKVDDSAAGPPRRPSHRARAGSTSTATALLSPTALAPGRARRP